MLAPQLAAPSAEVHIRAGSSGSSIAAGAPAAVRAGAVNPEQSWQHRQRIPMQQQQLQLDPAAPGPHPPVQQQPLYDRHSGPAGREGAPPPPHHQAAVPAAPSSSQQQHHQHAPRHLQLLDGGASLPFSLGLAGPSQATADYHHHHQHPLPYSLHSHPPLGYGNSGHFSDGPGVMPAPPLQSAAPLILMNYPYPPPGTAGGHTRGLVGGYDARQQQPVLGHELFGYDRRFENDAVLALDTSLQNLQLNPMAQEFVPPLNGGRQDRASGRKGGHHNRGAPQCYNLSGGGPAGPHGPLPRGTPQQSSWPARSGGGARGGGGRGGPRGGRRGGGHNGQRNLAANVRRTVYICDLDSQVTEEQLAGHFLECGQVVDCRVCGDPNSAMRFAFIEFTDEDAVTRALTKTGTVLGTCPLRVLRSKTAIVPVNNEYLPRSHQERELCVRTVYAGNIDKKVERKDVQNFFEGTCGTYAHHPLAFWAWLGAPPPVPG